MQHTHSRPDTITEKLNTCDSFSGSQVAFTDVVMMVTRCFYVIKEHSF